MAMRCQECGNWQNCVGTIAPTARICRWQLLRVIPPTSPEQAQRMDELAQDEDGVQAMRDGRHLEG